MLGVEPLKPHDASSGLHVADQRCVTTYAPREAPASTRPLITAGAGGGAGADEFAAVLVTSDGAGGLQELGRVALPGMPILGEGKPENQNLGLVFTRGAKLMVVDMNQDGYFEEALKVPSK